jgi:hypothetical protein
MKESTAEMSNEKEAAKEVAIERWEDEGGETPKTAASPSTTVPAIERRENEGGESQHTSEVSDDCAASSRH